QQRLFAIQMQVAQARAGGPDPELDRVLAKVADQVQAASSDLVALAHGLYATVLRERGLADGLRAEPAGAAAPVAILHRGIGRLPAPVEEAVYFCVLEAVQNAAKHGGPGTRVTITLQLRGDDLAFSVEDDGRGFGATTPGGGLGLTSMRDRIGAVRGV